MLIWGASSVQAKLWEFGRQPSIVHHRSDKISGALDKKSEGVDKKSVISRVEEHKSGGNLAQILARIARTPNESNTT